MNISPLNFHNTLRTLIAAATTLSRRHATIWSAATRRRLYSANPHAATLAPATTIALRRRLYGCKATSAFAAISLLAITLCIPPVSKAQAPAPPDQSQASQAAVPVIKSESKLVLVDAVVTDKKGAYVHDLTQKDFKIYEDNKEQQVATFSSGADVAIQANNQQKRFLIFFFDNSTMALPDQIQARGAAAKFITANASTEHMMAVVDFGGTLRIVQNFTANPDALTAAVSGVKHSNIDTNAPSDVGVNIASTSPTSIASSESEFGARTMLLAIRSLAKNLRSVPGRKMLILFSSGFVLTPENQSELTATIDACNKANVAIYSLDARGLFAPNSVSPRGGSARTTTPGGGTLRSVSSHSSLRAKSLASWQQPTAGTGRPRLTLASYSSSASPAPDPQHPGGGGAPGGGGGAPGGGGGVGGGGGRPGGGAPGGGGTTGSGGTGKGGSTGGGTTGGGTGTTGGTNPGGSRGAAGAPNYANPYNAYNNNNPYNQSRSIIPEFPKTASTNQQVLAALADGTGGFTIFNTNDLLGGLDKIGKEQNEFYIVGYVPPDSVEGSCHTLKVKMNRGGLNVRSRTGYCNARPENPISGKPIEKQLELRAAGGQPGSIHGALETPYFYSSANVARVNLAMEVPSDSFKFDKEKGKFHANVNILGIAYRSDGTIGARFNDTVNLDFDKDELKEFNKNPYRYMNQFDASPGTYKLTVVLSAGNGDSYGKFESPLQIDAWDGKKLTLGGVVLTNNAAKVSDIPSGLDSVLLEDRTPLVVQGLEVIPSATNRFKKDDHVIMYTEVYEPLLASDKPPRVGFAYRISDRATDKQLAFTGVQPLDNFIQKGNPVVPAGMAVSLKDLPPGAYRMTVQAVDELHNNAPPRYVDFDVIN
jgi:VWFA-related protein